MCFCKGHLHLSALGENSEIFILSIFSTFKNQTTNKMHIYTTKISKDPQQVLTLSTVRSKLGESPKLTSHFAISTIFVFLEEL